MSRGEYRPIYSVLLDSPEFQELSKDAKLLLYAIKVGLGPAGIGVLYDDQLAERAGLTRDELDPAREEMVQGDWLICDGRIHWLRNGLKYEPAISLNNEKHVTFVKRELAALPKVPLVNAFARYYGLPAPWPDLETPPDRDPGTEGEAKGYARATKGVSEGPPITNTYTNTPTTQDDDNAREEPPPDDAILELLPDHPDAAAVITRMAGGRIRAVVASLRMSFLYADDDPGRTPDGSVNGLGLEERRKLLARAVIELAAKNEAPGWHPPAISSFVARIRRGGGGTSKSSTAGRKVGPGGIILTA